MSARFLANAEFLEPIYTPVNWFAVVLPTVSLSVAVRRTIAVECYLRGVTR